MVMPWMMRLLGRVSLFVFCDCIFIFIVVKLVFLLFNNILCDIVTPFSLSNIISLIKALKQCFRNSQHYERKKSESSLSNIVLDMTKDKKFAQFIKSYEQPINGDGEELEKIAGDALQELKTKYSPVDTDGHPMGDEAARQSKLSFVCLESASVSLPLEIFAFSIICPLTLISLPLQLV